MPTKSIKMEYLVVLKNGNGDYGFACQITNGSASLAGSNNKEEALRQIPDNYNEKVELSGEWATSVGLHFISCQTHICEFESWDEVNKFVEKPLSTTVFGSSIARTERLGVAISKEMYEQLEGRIIKKTVLYDESSGL